MLFGGCLINGKQIKNDEEFEVAKEKFVKHFNKRHRNLMIDKQKTKGKFRKMNRDLAYTTVRGGNGVDIAVPSHDLVPDSGLDMLSLHDAQHESAYNMYLADEAEYHT